MEKATATGSISATADEGTQLILSAPQGEIFTSVDFASYGTPTNYTIDPNCHADFTSYISSIFLGNNSGIADANNGIAGDPCGGVYKHLSVTLSYAPDPNYIAPTPAPTPTQNMTLNAPENVVVTLDSATQEIIIKWTAPALTDVSVERYAIGWSTSTTNGWGVATGNVGDSTALNTFITIPVSTINQDGLDKDYLFTVRSDNDTLHIYSSQTNPVILFIPSVVIPTPTPTPTPSPTPIPTPSPTPTPTPTPSPTQIVIIPDPIPTPPPAPEPTPIAIPEPSPIPTPEPTPMPVPEPTPIPATEPTPTPAPEPTPEPSAVVEPTPPAIEPEPPVVKPEPPIIEPEPPAPTPELVADKNATDEEKAAVALALIASIEPGNSLTTEQIKEAGLSYSDLPPTTPVDVRTDENGNPVVITAEVAASLELLADPGALLAEAFTDPGAALQALGNIGADMSPAEREEATKMVVATVVAAGAAMNAITAAGGVSTSTGGSTGGNSGGSSGGGASGDSKGVRRRKP